MNIGAIMSNIDFDSYLMDDFDEDLPFCDVCGLVLDECICDYLEDGDE